jgi:hypothetical protein
MVAAINYIWNLSDKWVQYSTGPSAARSINVRMRYSLRNETVGSIFAARLAGR